MRIVRAIFYAATLVACFAPRAGADEVDKLSYLTFSGPFQIPGATLAAGTYTFKLADTSGNRHVVQILDKKTNKPIAMLPAIPDQRLEPSDKTVVMFSETPSGTPPAVKAWFYPGNTVGDQFVYPRKQAMRIAKESHTTVLSMPDNSASNRDSVKSAEVTRVNESGAVAETAPSSDSRRQGQVADNRVAQADTSSTGNARPRRTTLPQTASDLWLLQLLAGALLAAGLGVRMLRTRVNG
jgi:hypothetical protein